MRFWSMPGPARFLDDVLQAVDDGLNAVIAVPNETAGDVDAALMDRLRRQVIDRVTVDESADPVTQVARAFGMTERLRAYEDLFVDERFIDKDLIYLEGLSGRTWPAWQSFLSEFDEFSKDQPVDRRPRVIAVVDGVDPAAPVSEAVTFRVFRWRDRMSELDMAQYILGRLVHAPEHAGSRMLAASIVAKIALGDVRLAEELAARPFADIWYPEPVLRDWANQRGWIKGTHRHWTRGTQFRLNGQEHVHSALVALDDPGRIVESRVWAAQASMLLPGIERERLQLVRRARSWLRPPFALADGDQVSNAEELEIGPLEYQLARGRAPDELRRRATELKGLRNKLAHMERLSVEESLERGLL